MARERIEQFTETAKESSIKVTIEYGLPYIAVYRPTDGEEWYFQEHSATELLQSIPEDIHPESWLKVIANHW